MNHSMLEDAIQRRAVFARQSNTQTRAQCDKLWVEIQAKPATSYQALLWEVRIRLMQVNVSSHTSAVLDLDDTITNVPKMAG